MINLNMHYSELKDSYLFYNISEKIKAYRQANPDKELYHLGIGDVSLPLCDAVIKALHSAVDDQSRKETFQGYLPECGAPFFRKAISDFYVNKGIDIKPEEVFASSGASNELGDIIDLFDQSSKALIMEPAYPAYIDDSVIAGRKIFHQDTGRDTMFLASPDKSIDADLIYLCSPNNPTGAVYNYEQLKEWVDFANDRGAIILFDAAYEAFIEDDSIPHSIMQIDGAKTCAIEICSLSKTAGFTGTRLGYTIIPSELNRNGMNINSMWVRNRTTKTNGVSYIIQKGGAAVFTDEGQKEIHEILKVYKNNAKVLMKVLDELGIWYCGGKNAPYIWLKCPGNMSGWDFFDYLLNEIQVIGTPGEGFGKCGSGYFRLATFGDSKKTIIAAERIRDLISKKEN